MGNDHEAEFDAIKAYNAAIKLCVEAADNGTKELLDGILKDEESHIDEIESEQSKVEQMGLGLYLTTLTTEG